MNAPNTRREPISPAAAFALVGVGVFFAWIFASLAIRPDAAQTPGPDDWMDVVMLAWLAGCLCISGVYAAADGCRKFRRWSRNDYSGWTFNR